jgi:carbamoyl-phosphate synthase large subunit
MEDRFLIKRWRNDQLDLLRQKELLTDAEQDKYFYDVILKLYEQERPAQIIFSFLMKDELIGYGGLVHIDWKARVAEISFLLETTRNNNIELFKREFSIYLKLIKVIAFEEVKLFKINTCAFDVRNFLYPPLLENGFKEEARLRGVNVINGKRYDSVIHSFFFSDYARKFKPTFNVLVTSISAKISLLKQVRFAIERSEVNGLLYGGDIDDTCIGKYFVDVFWTMPLLNAENVKSIKNFCLQNDIKLIIPTRDGELAFWAELKAEFLASGISIMISSLSAIRATMDKLQFSEIGEKLGFPVVPSSLKISDIRSTSFVVKEQFGAGSRSMGLDLLKEKALEQAGSLKNPIFQPFIKGIEYSVDIFIKSNKVAKGVVCRKRVKVVNGESQVTTTEFNKELSDICTGFAVALKLYGHVMFQVLQDENGLFKIIECNARFGGASTLSIAAGLDSFYWLLLESNNHDLDSYPFRPVPTPLRQVRFASDLIESI